MKNISVHCSAGIGRSGTLVLVDTCLVLASMGVDLSLQLVLDTLLDLRTYRKGLIQTEQQLKFSADAIVQGMKELDLAPSNGHDQGPGHVTGGKRLIDAEVEDTHDANSQSQAKKRKNSTTS